MNMSMYPLATGISCESLSLKRSTWQYAQVTCACTCKKPSQSEYFIFILCTCHTRQSLLVSCILLAAFSLAWTHLDHAIHVYFFSNFGIDKSLLWTLNIFSSKQSRLSFCFVCPVHENARQIQSKPPNIQETASNSSLKSNAGRGDLTGCCTFLYPLRMLEHKLLPHWLAISQWLQMLMCRALAVNVKASAVLTSVHS